jgi:signal transduction histidine kinase
MKEDLDNNNSEFHSINKELRSSNKELANLIEATKIGIIFVDNNMKIRRFNRRVEMHFNFVESDLGHSLDEVIQKLQYDPVDDVKQVFDQLESVHKLIFCETGKWYIFKVDPYKTIEDVEGALLTFVDITDLKQALEDKIEAKNRLEREILRIEKKERWRIGQYLHDETAQTLVSAQMLAKIVFPKIKQVDKETKKDLDKIKSLIDESLDNIRELSHFVLPIEIGKGGISSAFQKLARQTEDLYHINCSFSSDETIDRISNISSASYLYYIAQEAIRNAISHGQAKRIDVNLYSDEDSLYLKVEDDGKGYEEGDQDKGMGVNIMRYRAELLGGTLDIKQASKEKGTILICRVPLEQLNEK